MSGMNLLAFFFMNFENFFIRLSHFPTTSSLPFVPKKNIIMSPIARAVPAVIPSRIGFRPPIANVARVVMNMMEPPVENPPKNEIMNRIRKVFVTPSFVTISVGLKKNSDVIRAVRKATIIRNSVICFVCFFMTPIPRIERGCPKGPVF